jgi:N-dimethylarginine dimethylaminohydrolase
MKRAEAGRILMTSPDHYEVSYTINPWMQPEAWARDPATLKITARAQWNRLRALLEEAGLEVEVVPGEPGLPDMVFPANAAIVLDGRALLARFRHRERTGEEAAFRRIFEGLAARGLVEEIGEFSAGLAQEGAGDCIWDASRGLFWAGFGPRSDAWALSEVTDFFRQPVAALLLATEHYYHLDTCFCPLPGGEILYYPEAFATRSAGLIEEIVPKEARITATADEAAAFSLNTVATGRDLIMAIPPPRLRAVLEERGYRCHATDLSSFMLSGGGAFCMTLRLDLMSAARTQAAREGDLSCSTSRPAMPR